MTYPEGAAQDRPITGSRAKRPTGSGPPFDGDDAAEGVRGFHARAPDQGAPASRQLHRAPHPNAARGTCGATAEDRMRGTLEEEVATAGVDA